MVDNSTAGFEFISALICEYATEGADGRHTFAGVYADDIFVEPDRTLPVPYYLAFKVRPLQIEGEIFVQLSSKTGAVRTSVSFQGDGEQPHPYDRITFVTKIEFPQLDLGLHTFSIGPSFDELTDVHTFRIMKLELTNSTEKTE